MRKILVVDDETGVLTAIAELIRDHEFAVIAETSLWKALSKCARDAPDLVLCDLMLGDVKPAAVGGLAPETLLELARHIAHESRRNHLVDRLEHV